MITFKFLGIYSIPPLTLSCHSLSSSHLPSAASFACFGHDVGSKWAILELASVKISLMASVSALDTSSKETIPAFTNASAAFGPMP